MKMRCKPFRSLPSGNYDVWVCPEGIRVMDPITGNYSLMHSLGAAAQRRAYELSLDLVRELIADVARIVGDDGTGSIGLAVRMALLDEPNPTAREIADIILEARADAARETTEIER